MRAGQAMQPELVDDRLDLGEVGDLVDQRVGFIAQEGMSTTPAGTGPAVGGGTQLLRGYEWALGLGMSRLSAAVRPVGGAGGLRFRPMGSDEGGLEELVELSWSRAERSRTVASNSAIRSLRESQATKRAAWASSGTVFQRGSGIGSSGFIYR